MKRPAAALGAMLGTCLLASSALAHPSPAEPPAFFEDDCILVLDKQAQSVWHLDYAVLLDDTAPEVDHVSLPDSKTHQFFALAGTLQARANDHVFIPFDDEAGRLAIMPTWLTEEDVMRAAAAVTAEDMTAFTADQVLAEDILERDPQLARAVLPMAAGTERVPITAAFASAGVDWDLTDVPPGAYQIAAYIFSPPYNGWAVRPGLVKVVDGAGEEAEPAAITLKPVAARLFTGQGRRVRGCVDAPSGSTLELSTRVQGETPGAFEPSVTQAVSRGDFELCLINEGLDAALEVRLEVRTPSGGYAATQASEVLSLFSNAAACVESETMCCPAVAVPDAGVAREDASVPVEPVQPGATVDAAAPDAMRTKEDEAAPQPEPTTGGAAAPSSGCAVGAYRTSTPAGLVLLVLALLTCTARARAKLARSRRGSIRSRAWTSRCPSRAASSS